MPQPAVPVDICNMALSKMGARAKINSLNDTSPAAIHCNIWYDHLRQLLIRSAPWGFCRMTVQLSPLGSVNNTPPDNQYPWLFNYAYPPDCLRMRYIIPVPPPAPNVVPPNPGQPLLWSPWMMPRRDFRYLVTNIGSQKQIVSNLNNAIAIYNSDVKDVSLFDPGFADALVGALAAELVLPLAGNVQLKQMLSQIAMMEVTEAKSMDGAEAIAKVDHVPDWIQARSFGAEASYAGGTLSAWGMWNTDWSGGYGGYGN